MSVGYTIKGQQEENVLKGTSEKNTGIVLYSLVSSIDALFEPLSQPAFNKSPNWHIP